MASEAPQYKVETLVDMARIPEEALPRFLAELPDMIRMARPMVMLADASDGAFKLTIPAVWIDDDKGEFSTSVEVNGDEVFSARGKIPSRGGEAA